MKRAALYVRVSTDAQAEEGYSIDEQIARLQAYCQAQDWVPAKIYKDAGYSGSNLNRPGITALIRDAGQYDVIIVYRLDRLSRSQKDTLYLIEDAFAGTAFVSITESFDTSTSVGKMMIGILSAFAQLERERIKERMQTGRIGRAKSGKTMRWSNPPFGYAYADGALTLNPIAADVIRRIYAWYLSGISQSQIKRMLNADGHVGRNTPWENANVNRVLTNAFYAGENLYLGVAYDGVHEAVIDERTFQRTQQEIARRQGEAYQKGQPRPFQSKYLLSGLLYCKRCGHRFMVTLYKPRKDGTRRRLYRCVSACAESTVGEVRRAESCDAKSYDVESIESAVLAEIEKLRLNPEMVIRNQDDVQRAANEVKKIDKRLKAIEKAEERLVGLYVEGNMPIGAMNSKRDSLSDEKRLLMTHRDTLLHESNELTRDDVRAILGGANISVNKLDHDVQKRIVHTLIKRIELDGDDMVITWRFN